MSVLLETSVGEIVIDLETKLCPKASTNFLKLCKSYYYNYSTFFSVQPRFIAQTGDPSNSGTGGECVWARLGSMRSQKDRYFVPEMPASLKHRTRGTVSLALIERADPDRPGETQLVAGSQFFITLADNIDYLDGKHAVIGHVVEGQESGGPLDKLDAAFVDDQNRPLTDIRIRGVVVLDDPFPDPTGLKVPSRTPSPTPEQLASVRLSEKEAADMDENELPPEEKEAQERAKSSRSAALTLEMVGDLPFADIRPPENILFVCKLNPVTRSEDLELIFSRFGQILTCEVIRDKKSGDSLQYAFIEFAEKEMAEQAYFKMQNTLIDDRRIWVDFSQSVSKLHGDWLTKRLGGRKPPADKLVRERPESGSSRYEDRAARHGGSRDADYRSRGGGDRDRRDGHRPRDYGHERDSRDRERAREYSYESHRSRDYSHRDHQSSRERDKYRDESRSHGHGREREEKSSYRDEYRRDRDRASSPPRRSR
ncbi:Peptidyl-prolyl cis-trans isomerase-like 4 [Tilletia horrida]|nr:Peptidyl-prolyl cis-trans isomerase-like 4 [Tilletia horrida]